MKKLDQRTSELSEIRKDLLSQIRDFFLLNPTVKINVEGSGYTLFDHQEVTEITPEGVIANDSLLPFGEMDLDDIDYTVGVINNFIEDTKG